MGSEANPSFWLCHSKGVDWRLNIGAMLHSLPHTLVDGLQLLLCMTGEQLYQITS